MSNGDKWCDKHECRYWEHLERSACQYEAEIKALKEQIDARDIVISNLNEIGKRLQKESRTHAEKIIELNIYIRNNCIHYLNFSQCPCHPDLVNKNCPLFTKSPNKAKREKVKCKNCGEVITRPDEHWHHPMTESDYEGYTCKPKQNVKEEDR